MYKIEYFNIDELETDIKVVYEFVMLKKDRVEFERKLHDLIDKYKI